MTIKLGLELTALEGEHRTRGIGRVAQAYFEYLSQHDDVELVPYIKGDFPKSEPNGTGDWSDQLMDPFKLSWFVRRESPDLIQVLDPMKVPSVSSKPVVTMVHDLIPYLYSERYQTNLWSRFIHWRMKHQIRSSEFIITPSRCTADDLTMLFEINEDRVKPMYHGIDSDRFYPRKSEVVESTLDRYDVEKPYFLMVSDLHNYDPRKKLQDVVDAWNHDLFNEVSLVVVGKKGEYSDRLREKWSGREDKLVFPGYVNDDELASFYTGAKLLIFPSRYEGFGFPVIESMACGTCPVVRGVGSVEEIVGDEAIVLGEDTFSDELMDVLADNVGRMDRDQTCLEHAAEFTWERTIETLVELYQELIRESEQSSTSSIKT